MNDWLAAETGIPIGAAEQIVTYLAESRRVLGVLPTQDTLVLERFFDESGGMQLVLHAPFGSRINKAWGLALRKRFCRQFNFELQAAATEDALMLSLGPQHSFPLADVFRYLHPATARDVLVQAFLDAPVFQTRWRWNTTIALAVPRNRGGRKVPPPLQRMLADDLMAAVFPDAAACLENIPGDRVIPDHPLVGQTVRDCLEEAMDFNALAALLERIHAGQIRCVACDTPEPSPLAHEILNARPYAFLDDAPLEERRAQAVRTRRATEPGSAGELGALDHDAIARVRDEAAPDPRDADELHDVLLTVGFLTCEESARIASTFFEQLSATGRAAVVQGAPVAQGFSPAFDGPNAGDRTVWVAAERLPEILAVHPGATVAPAIEAPASRADRAWTREDAIRELLRGRLGILGPTTARALAESLSVDEAAADAALLALESEGVVLRGLFESRPPSLLGTSVPAGRGAGPAGTEVAGRDGGRDQQWCDRRLLARIHRYTLNRLRAEIEPVSPADFMRFLFAWQHVDPEHRLIGIDGLRSVLEQLDGFELAADSWERAVLPARVDGYEPSMMDTLCLTGEVGWARLSAPAAEPTQVVSATPVALFLRAHADAWAALKGSAGMVPAALKATKDGDVAQGSSPACLRVLETLRIRGASFEHELVAASGADVTAMRAALRDLVAAGLIASDGFGGLRSIIRASSGRPGAAGHRSSIAGRWCLLPDVAEERTGTPSAVEVQARTLLRRYGVVFRRLLAREANIAPWRDLARVYRRLEARGEIRGGRFVSGMSGEQFALGDAVERLREVRRSTAHGRCLAIGAADPLNLAGLVTAGERVRAVATNRLVYRDGVPIAALEGEYVRSLTDVEPAVASDAVRVLTGRHTLSVISGFVGR